MLAARVVLWIPIMEVTCHSQTLCFRNKQNGIPSQCFRANCLLPIKRIRKEYKQIIAKFLVAEREGAMLEIHAVKHELEPDGISDFC
jgi:hypothetical protein